LIVRADSTGKRRRVTEANETNNILAIALTVARADLAVMAGRRRPWRRRA
jgi:hypothetical protein